MSIDTRIYLQAHATPKKVFEVLQKCTGEEFEYRSFDNKHFDSSKPSDYNNQWHLKAKANQNNIEVELDYVSFSFVDPVGNNYNCLYHLYVEDDDNSFNNEKVLSPKSHPVWIALGRRLVDFFGGKLIYADCGDHEDPENWYVNKKPKFGAKEQGQSGDDRWYQYHNALNTENLLTSKEILDVVPLSAYPTEERGTSLIEYLSKYENALELNKQLKRKTTTKKEKKKI